MLRTIDRYELLEEIGHGGMATVYRARDTRLDRLVAIKIMHPHLRGAREARARFVREAKSVARLTHANILQIFDNSSEDSEESYIVTELLTGPTLKEFAEKNGPIPAEVAAAFTIELARALAAAHAAGLIHRDVKPENALLHEDRCVKLTDFGIAQMVDSQSFTATGQILGSPGHMAPEQIEGADCDVRTDIFALGTVLYYLATGRLPFTGRNPPQILKRIIDGEFADPLRMRPSIGGRLRAIIVKALAREPKDRYASAEEFERALVEFVREVGIEDSSATLAAFIGDPEKVRGEIHARVIKELSNAGERAAAAGDLPTALDHFNRVLALDETNARVMKLLDRIGRRSRQRSRIVAVGSGVAMFGVAAMAYAIFGPEPGPNDHPTPDGGAVIVNDPPPSDASPDRALGDARADSSDEDASSTDAPSDPDDARPTRPDVRPAARDPRFVVFRVYPQQGVRVSVDGSPPRELSTSFLGMTLVPGPHRFQYLSGDDCCADLSFVESIPPGDDQLILDTRNLPFNDARLYVTAPVPADVAIDGRTRGRTREFIPIPMNRLDEAMRLTVTAPGHQAYTATVSVRAGQTTEHSAALVPAEETP